MGRNGIHSSDGDQTHKEVPHVSKTYTQMPIVCHAELLKQTIRFGQELKTVVCQQNLKHSDCLNKVLLKHVPP